ncbi:hypothetical protein [Paraburkholderia humisilvae]|uniref:hypothetical protein n=1 Tax=Paraburkholderia humisilvae TaxID=627669 RepID=UPI001583BB30
MHIFKRAALVAAIEPLMNPDADTRRPRNGAWQFIQEVVEQDLDQISSSPTHIQP